MLEGSGGALEQGAYGIGTGLGVAAGFAILRWFLTFIAGRLDIQHARVDASQDKLIKALEGQIESLTDRFEKAMVRVDKVENDLDECRTKHADAEAELKSLRAIVTMQGSMRNEAQTIIAADKRARGGK